jgi:hypothetical protein
MIQLSFHKYGTMSVSVLQNFVNEFILKLTAYINSIGNEKDKASRQYNKS